MQTGYTPCESAIIGSAMSIKKFQKILLSWYAKNRRDLPWRNTKDPYKILVSEIMLQQTQVSRVLPKYKEFLKAFPTLEALAKSSDKKLLKVWSELGYWRRAKYLKETAKIITKEYGGKFPKDPKILETFPGIGHYTARALACFAFGSTEAFLDTNIRRVYLHFFFPEKHHVSDKEILKVAQRATTNLCVRGKLKYHGITPREWHYALFDYGALVLKDKAINKQSRHYAKQSRFEGSFRSFRSKVVKFLLAASRPAIPKEEIEQFLQKELRAAGSKHSAQEIIRSLVKNKLIKENVGKYSL